MGFNVFLFIVLVINVLLDFYVLSQINKRNLLRLYKVIAGFFSVFILVLSLIPWSSQGDDGLQLFMRCLLVLSTFFFAKTAFILPSILGLFLDFCVKKLFKIRLNKIFNFIGVICAVSVVLSMIYGYAVTARTPVVNEVVIESDKLPDSFDGYRIVQISDFHLGTFGNDTVFAGKVVDEINSTSPDLILFTGDLVNSLAKEAFPFKLVISELVAKNGVFSVLGNHDYGDYYHWKTDEDKRMNLNSLMELQSECGWHLLLNESRIIHLNGDSIALVGVENWGEPPFPRYGDLTKAYTDLNDSTYKILMSHNPVHWRAEVLNNTNIDLMLAGHTHAMQFVIDLFGHKWSPAKYRYREWGGLYENDGQLLYVNQGLGEVGIPLRVGANPEITLIILRRKHD